jgi:hypothetical protein
MPGIYRRKETVVRRDVAGQTLLVPIGSGTANLQRVFSLDAAGRCIWEALAEARTEDQLAAAVCERFDVDEERARSDARSFIADLLKAELADEV